MPSKSQAIYERLPRPVRKVAFAAKARSIHRTRYGGDFERVYNEVLRREHWTTDELHAHRAARLASMIGPKSSLSTPLELQEWLESQPRLTREEARARAATLGHVRGGVTAATGGTSGSPLRFSTTRGALQEQWAVWWRFRHWHGIGRGTWAAHFGGQPVVPGRIASPPYWHTNQLSRQVYFSPLHLSRETVALYLAEMRHSRLQWIHGYPSLVARLASLILELGLDVGYQVGWVTTGAENLTEGQRQVIELAFGVEPRQHYGLAEAVANFSECESGRLHVDEDFAVVEFVPRGDGCADVLGTTLTNPLFSFLRYEVGDLATLSDDACPCGRLGRVVHSLDGRASDFLHLPDGRLLGPANQIFKGIPGIREGRLRYEDGRVVAELVGLSSLVGVPVEARQEVQRRIVARASGVQCDVTAVPTLPREASGKLRAVVPWSP